LSDLYYGGFADASSVVAPSPTDLPSRVVVNLVPNPSFETNAALWWIPSGTSTLTRDSAHAKSGSWSGRLDLDPSALVSLIVAPTGQNQAGTMIPVTAGASYTASTWFYNPSVNGASYIGIYLTFYQSDQATDASLGSGNAVSTADSTTKDAWGRVSATGVAPPDAAYVVVYPQLSTPAGAGRRVWFDAVMATVSEAAIPDAFDGDTAGDAFYSYDWTGTAHASASTRTAL
jgi:hypothetical protein